MTSIRETAEQFFIACETGKGWEVCKRFCRANATFSAQADALAGITTAMQYTEWMKAAFTPLPDATHVLRSLALDEARGHVLAFGVFRATHTGEGGPVPATRRRAETEFVYIMEFDGDQIRHLIKVWNDGHCMKQLGWG